MIQTAMNFAAIEAGEKDVNTTRGTNRESVVMCPEHDLPLNFWSEKEAIYKCIKCLINEKEVHFVDHSYKGQFERFREIRTMTSTIMEENKYLPCTIKDWKEDIRDVLLRVKAQMIDFIDDFTERFVR